MRGVLHVVHSDPSILDILHFRAGREARIQQDDSFAVRNRPAEELGDWICHWSTFLGGVLVGVQVGGRPFRSMAHGFPVSVVRLSEGCVWTEGEQPVIPDYHGCPLPNCDPAAIQQTLPAG